MFRRITLPLMAPVLVLLLLRDTILSLQFSFVPALVVTDGGPPPYATTYLSLFVYRNAFEYLRYGYAAAATLVMLRAHDHRGRRAVAADPAVREALTP